MSERIGKPTKLQLKGWERLSMAKYRLRERRFLAEGGKVVAELLRSGRPVESLLVREASAGRWQALLADKIVTTTMCASCGTRNS